MAELIQCLKRRANKEEIESLILEKKCNINYTAMPNEQSSLHYVSNYEETYAAALTKLLVMNGADVNACNYMNQTPLMKFLERGYLESVKIILEAGASVKCRDKFGNPTLHYARVHDKFKAPALVRILFEYGVGADTEDCKGDMYLVNFLKIGLHDEVIRIFLEAGADANWIDRAGNTLLHYLYEYKDEIVLKRVLGYLTERGCCLTARNNDGLTPFMCHFVQQGPNMSEGLVNVYLEAGSDANCRDNEENNILHYISSYRSEDQNMQLIRMLLDKGVSVNSPNTNDQTPFTKFLFNSHNKEIIKMLLQAGGGIHCKTKILVNINDKRTEDKESKCTRKTASTCLVCSDEDEDLDDEDLVEDEEEEEEECSGTLFCFKRNNFYKRIIRNRNRRGDSSNLCPHSKYHHGTMSFSKKSVQVNDVGWRAIDYCLLLCLQCPEFVQDLQMLKMTIDNGADVNMVYNGKPILIWCFQNKVCRDSIEMLLKYHASFNCNKYNYVFNYIVARDESLVKIACVYWLLEVYEDNNQRAFIDIDRIMPNISCLVHSRPRIAPMILLSLQREIKELNRFYIKKSVSLLDFCRTNKRQLLFSYSRGCKFDLSEIKRKFPHFINMIKHKLDLVQEWQNALLNIDHIILSNKLPVGGKEISLNSHCLRHLAAFLHYTDLLVLLTKSK